MFSLIMEKEIRAQEGDLEKSAQQQEEERYVPYIVSMRAGGILGGHYQPANLYHNSA